MGGHVDMCGYDRIYKPVSSSNRFIASRNVYHVELEISYHDIPCYLYVVYKFIMKSPKGSFVQG